MERRCSASLRDEVIPLYYDRDQDGLPRGWIRRMKRAIRTLGWRFSADRMVMDYVLKVLHPGGRRHEFGRRLTFMRMHEPSGSQSADFSSLSYSAIRMSKV